MLNFAGVELEIVLNVFSGEENPRIELTAAHLLKLVGQLSELKEEAKAVVAGTGYAGFTLTRRSVRQGGEDPGTVIVFRGTVTHRRPGQEPKVYKDGFGLEAMLIRAATEQGYIDETTPTEPPPQKSPGYFSTLFTLFKNIFSGNGYLWKFFVQLFTGKFTPRKPANDEATVETKAPEKPTHELPTAEDDAPVNESPLPVDPNAGDTPDDVSVNPPPPPPNDDSSSGSPRPTTPTTTRNDTYRGHSPGAKPYQPWNWKDDYVNRCYSYGNNRKLSQTTRPGRGGGKELPPAYNSKKSGSGYGGTDLINALKADGLLDNKKTTPCTAQSWKIAWMYKLKSTSNSKSGIDYHFVRMDRNGLWSHKPGQLDVINTDDNGNLILDPKLSFDQGGFKAYNRFGGFICTDDLIAGNIK